ncbi:MAG: hypothetical protein LBK66_07440, partial [Spirochaetaceae bacterium]|nr:hypothetical protein [Spirochaetaceae bacterium]
PPPPNEPEYEPQITQINTNYRSKGKTPKAAIEAKASPPPTRGGKTLTRSVCKPAGMLTRSVCETRWRAGGGGRLP